MKRFIAAALVCFLSGTPIYAAGTIKAAVVRSTGTMFLGQTIWNDLNTGWDRFGDTPVQIDYTSLGGSGWGLPQIQATGANVLIMSAPGYMNYTDAEMAAVKQYVEDGHGLIYTYGLFRGADKVLAPLVGLSESMTLGTGTALDPIQFELLQPDHPVFSRLHQPYVSGVPYMAFPAPYPSPWVLDDGVILANKYTALFPSDAGIIAHETSMYRGLYFSHYIEDKSGGTNAQDTQVFYNGLIWAGTPEPASLLFFLVTPALLTRRTAKRPKRPPELAGPGSA
jgi:hypothetical protein